MFKLILAGIVLLLIAGAGSYLYLLHRARKALTGAIKDAVLDAYKAGDSWVYKKDE